MFDTEKREVQATASETRPTYAELRAWVETVRQGNFSKAAESLGLSPVTVQLSVRNLSEKVERLLGPDVKLYAYHAGDRRIQPTEQGRQLFDWCVAAVADIEHATDFIQNLQVKDASLSVSAPLALWEHELFPVVGEIRKQEPDLALKMYVRGSSDGIDLLRAKECHVAFVGQGALAAKTLPGRIQSHEYKTYGVDLIVSKNDCLLEEQEFQNKLRCARKGDAACTKAVLQRIADAHPLILLGGWSAFRQGIDAFFLDHGIDLSTNMVELHELDMGRGILRAVAAGLGVAILWHVAKEEEELEQQVERISLEGMIPNWTVCAVWDPLFLSEPARELLRRTCHVEL
ncbi:MAG: LysR substrate-binding domain-containing protein [Xenococcaceae cyanobacterium]